jgi:predicted transcriptional regulator of viral defense system
VKYVKDIKEEFSGVTKPVFGINELKSIKGLSPGYRRLLLHNLLKRGSIAKITRGVYTFHKDMVVLCFAFAPSYYGLENALTIRGLSEQATNPIIMNLVYRMRPELFFGYELVRRGDFWVPVSDLEKTVIDMLYFKNEIRDELWRNILPNLDTKKLDTYLQKYKPDFRKKVMDTVKSTKRLPKQKVHAKANS